MNTSQASSPALSLVQPSTEDTYLLPGDIASLVPLNPGEADPVRYKISDCGEMNTKASPPVICSHAPVIQPFLNQPIGHTARVLRHGTMVEMMLDGIERP